MSIASDVLKDITTSSRFISCIRSRINFDKDGGITFKYATESTNTQENKLDLYVYDQVSNVPETISLNHVSSVEEKWESVEVLGLPFNKCNTPGDVCIFVIEMSSSKDSYTRVGDIEIKYERNL